MDQLSTSVHNVLGYITIFFFFLMVASIIINKFIDKAWLIGFSWGFLLLFGVATVSCRKIIERDIKAEVREKIKTFQSTSGELKVNNQLVDNPADVLSSLQKIRNYDAHHSSPGTAIEVAMNNAKESTIILLRRDSQDSSEYWVYYPKYEFSTNHEIGRIKSSIFKQY